MKSFTTVDAYINSYPKDVQVFLKQMRATIKKAAPKATEAMKYGMPAFIFHENLVFFGGFKNHIGFFPTPSGVSNFAKELSKYETSKGTIQFPLTEKLPLALVTKITKFRVKEVLEKQKGKTASKQKQTSTNKPHIVYHKDGSVWAKGKTVAGKMEGYWQWFRKPAKGKKVGTIMRSGYFKKGKQTGEWTTYDSTGRVVRVTKIK